MALSKDELTNIAFRIADRFEKVNLFYLSKMAEQIKEIGKLDKDNMHRLEQMAKMGNNIEEINLYLSKQSGLALQDIYKLYDKSAGEIYKDVAYLYKHNGITQPAFSKNTAIQNYISSVRNLTAGTFANMANTTSIAQDYKDAIDLAIDTVATGMDGYQDALERIILDKATQGARVQYSSGRTRRLDSAARMNILEGVRQVNYGVRLEAGKQYGADGIEIDAHGLCAEDHLPYQGRQYSLSKYNSINARLKRHFGTCNCQHGISYIILGVSPPTYDDKELQNIKDYSNEKIKIGDKEITRYEASQVMRNLETKMRYKQEQIIALQKAGKDVEKQKKQLKNLKQSYGYASKQANLRRQWNRAKVPGYDL